MCYSDIDFLVHRCASSKHLQTRRFLDTLKGYLFDVQRILIQLHLSANERSEPFVDHAGILRDSKTGRPINGRVSPDGVESAYGDENTVREYRIVFIIAGGNSVTHAFVCVAAAGYSFFDSGDVELLGRRRVPAYYSTGKILFATIPSFVH